MNRKNICYWLLLPVLALMMGACGESKSDDNGEIKTPDVPVAEGDWQVVPAKGGTIEKGDIVIEFPSGTFKSDAKVAVTETAPFSNARSKCYQVVLPETGTDKPFTVKLKCEGSTENVLGIARTIGWSPHTGKDFTFDAKLEPSVENDILSFEIPEADSDGNETPFFTIGLVEYPQSMMTQNTRLGYYKTWVTTDEIEKYGKETKKYEDLRNRISNMSNYVIDILVSRLGFEFPEKGYYNMPIVKYELTNDQEILDGSQGVFVNARFFRKLSQVYLKESQFWKLVSSTSTESLLEALANNYETLIHETFHYISYFSYNNQWASTICIKGAAGDDWGQFDEAVGCWVEQFVGNFTFVGLNTKTELKKFVSEFYPHERNDINCREWGYGMSVFVEFLAINCGGEKAISNFYKQWRDGGNKDNFRSDIKALLATHNVEFFDSKHYYDFIYSIMNGKFSNKLDYTNTIQSTIPVKGRSRTVKGSVYNYGTTVQLLPFDYDILKEMKDSSICITQKEPGVLTRVYYVNDKTKEIKELAECEKDKPFVFEVSKFADLAHQPIDDFTESKDILLTTIRKTNQDDYSSLPSEINVEIRADSCEIREIQAKVELAQLMDGKECNYKFTASNTFKSSDKSIQTVRVGNSLHVTCSAKRVGELYIYEGTLSFDIDDFSDDAIRNKKANIINLHYSYTKEPTEKEKKSYHNNHIESLEIPKIPIMEGTPHLNGVWYGTRGEGVNFNNFVCKSTFYKSDGSVDDVDEYTLVGSSDDNVRILIDFGGNAN